MAFTEDTDIQKPYFNRAAPRLLVHKTLDVKEGNTQQLAGRLFDMSAEGFMLIGQMEIGDNQEYDFELNLSESTTPHPSTETIVFSAECRWSELFKKSGFYGAGFIITHIDSQSLALWQELLKAF